MSEVEEFARAVADNVERVIVGKRDVVELAIVALLCEGHVLFEDVPGVGKTMLARSIAASVGCSFKRIQFTPDLLPNDVTGVSVFNQLNAQFEFRPGPAFVNVLLADEINRATPRTQSALLECMGEHQITVDGETHYLPQPFLVMATQNPIEYEGTFPLPEAQLDRFLMRLRIGYPSPEDERRIAINLRRVHPIMEIGQAADGARLPELQRQVWDVHMDDSILDYIVNLVGHTRSHPDVSLGASPRGTLALYKTSQALAAVRGRNYVIPDEVKRLAPLVLGHRIVLRAESQLRGITIDEVLTSVLESSRLDLGESRWA